MRSSVWDLRFANIALRCSVLNSLLRSSFWDLKLGVFKCVILGLGRWAPEVGGTAWRQLEAHGQRQAAPTPEIVRTPWAKLSGQSWVWERRDFQFVNKQLYTYIYIYIHIHLHTLEFELTTSRVRLRNTVFIGRAVMRLPKRWQAPVSPVGTSWRIVITCCSRDVLRRLSLSILFERHPLRVHLRLAF